MATKDDIINSLSGTVYNIFHTFMFGLASGGVALVWLWIMDIAGHKPVTLPQAQFLGLVVGSTVALYNLNR